MSTDLTPEELARREALVEEIVAELRAEEAAREQLRIFAVHGDSSNFDRDDARALWRLLSELEQSRKVAIHALDALGLKPGEAICGIPESAHDCARVCLLPARHIEDGRWHAGLGATWGLGRDRTDEEDPS